VFFNYLRVVKYAPKNKNKNKSKNKNKNKKSKVMEGQKIKYY
jgi:hypothetical protein